MIDKTLEKLSLGDKASFEKRIAEEDVAEFARLSGDRNPIHMDETYALQSPMGRRVVHGMYLGALVSCLVGMHLPGKRSLLLKEELQFKSPAFIGDAVTVEGEVVAKSESTRILTIAVTIKRGSTVLVQGSASVQVYE